VRGTRGMIGTSPFMKVASSAAVNRRGEPPRRRAYEIRRRTVWWAAAARLACDIGSATAVYALPIGVVPIAVSPHRSFRRNRRATRRRSSRGRAQAPHAAAQWAACLGWRRAGLHRGVRTPRRPGGGDRRLSGRRRCRRDLVVGVPGLARSPRISSPLGDRAAAPGTPRPGLANHVATRARDRRIRLLVQQRAPAHFTRRRPSSRVRTSPRQAGQGQLAYVRSRECGAG
jgi:hypothetical protein